MAEPEVKFTVSPRMFVASITQKGPYPGVADSIRELKEWIDSKGIEQAGYPFCLFYDDPTERKASELRSEACIPVAGPFEPEGNVESKAIPETTVAETRHEGPPEDFPKAYGSFLEGLRKAGYRTVGPAREYFMAVADVTKRGAGFLIQQPIEKS